MDHDQLWITSIACSYVYVCMQSLYIYIRIIKVFTKVKFPMILCHKILTNSCQCLGSVAPQAPAGEFVFNLDTPVWNIFLRFDNVSSTHELQSVFHSLAICLTI